MLQANISSLSLWMNERAQTEGLSYQQIAHTTNQCTVPSVLSGSDDDDDGDGDVGSEMWGAGIYVCNTPKIASYVRSISVTHLHSHMSRAAGNE